MDSYLSINFESQDKQSQQRSPEQHKRKLAGIFMAINSSFAKYTAAAQNKTAR